MLDKDNKMRYNKVQIKCEIMCFFVFYYAIYPFKIKEKRKENV